MSIHTEHKNGMFRYSLSTVFQCNNWMSGFVIFLVRSDDGVLCSLSLIYEMFVRSVCVLFWIWIRWEDMNQLFQQGRYFLAWNVRIIFSETNHPHQSKMCFKGKISAALFVLNNRSIEWEKNKTKEFLWKFVIDWGKTSPCQRQDI